MAIAPVFRAALGLNNVTEPHRLKYREEGSCPLAEAVNVIIDDSGSVMRRFGVTSLREGAHHSLWAQGKWCFFVSDGNLFRRFLSGTNAQIFTGCGDAQMYYSVFGDRVYCTNGTFKAVVSESAIAAWSATIGHQRGTDTRTLGLPSMSGPICRHAGRMYVADGRYLWESDPGYAGCFDLGDGWLDMGADIAAMISVRGGLFVSTAIETIFLSGSSKADFVLVNAHPAPIVHGTQSHIMGDDIADGTMFTGRCAVWVSPDGVCIGSEDGKVMNVTSRKLRFDEPTSGAGVAMPGQYLFSLEA